ncbi:MAG: HepT-like ribonuclease domain-containing protein [Armatimonadota bacterium]
MFNDDTIRLRHMLDAAHEAVGFTRSRSRKDLNSDRMLVLSLVKDIEIIGEAANQVSDTMRRELDNIPWDDMIGMRHRLVHAYFDINLDILWRTVQNDLPALIVILESVITEEAS